MSSHFIYVVVILASAANAVIIDNEVEVQPRVYCFQNGLKLQVETKNPFTGHIYVKGMYGNPQCNRNFTGETKQPALNVAYGECIHNREPLHTGGMMFTLEIIVQFHPYFTTKIDRAFIVSCSYREAVNVVTQNQVLQGNVMLPDGSSDSIPVTRVSYAPLMPNCQYTIHRGSPDGPQISFARVGEKVVHKWQCLPTADGEFHGILVHNCFARDVRGVNKIHILDKRGCTLDPFSLPTPTYTLDLTMAYAAVHAFKFADDLQISFACSVSLCLRMNSGCVGISPPQCESATPASTQAPYQPPQQPSYQPNPPAVQGYPPPANSRKVLYSFQNSAPSQSILSSNSYLNISYDAFVLNSSAVIINESLDIAMPEPPPVDVFLKWPSKQDQLYQPVARFIHDGRNAAVDASSNSSFLKSEIDFDYQNPTKRTIPPQNLNNVPFPSTKQYVAPVSTTTRASTVPSTAFTTTSPLTTQSTTTILYPTTSYEQLQYPSPTEATLGLFVGEGIINIEPVIHTSNGPVLVPISSAQQQQAGAPVGVQIVPPSFRPVAVGTNRIASALQSSSSFDSSKQKDDKPITHLHKAKRLRSFHKLRPTTTQVPLDEFDPDMLQASVDVQSQDFVVFDRHNPMNADNETTLFDDDEFPYSNRHDICITTFAFAQIVIALAIVFATFIALGVFLHMRHRKKCLISDMHY